jgi:RND family efflux transporter MFP subunit
MKHSKQTRLAALTLAAVMTLAGCGSSEDTTEEASTAAGVAVQVETVSAETIATDNQVSGKISSGDETSILIATTAKCTAVYVNAGDTVRAGDKLCTLDLGSSLSSYNAARISYDSAVQSYQDQKAILEKQVQMAADNVDNTKALLEIGAASQLEVDQAELSYQNAVASQNSALAQLEAAIQNAKSGLEQLDTALDNVDSSGNVIAPVSGTVTTLNAVANSYISNSMPVAVIESGGQMQVIASVSETLVPRLAIGDTADVTVSATGQVFTAAIRSVDRSANLQTSLYTVTLTVPEEVEGLLSGMFADVTFHTDVSENAIVVPSEAILTSGSDQYVFVVENDTAKYVAVTTGLTGNGVTEITSGLEAGQQLVTVGQAYLSDGAAVRIVSGEA